MCNRVAFGPEAGASTDPFLAMVEDRMRKPGGYPDHPHRGIETVTLVLSGGLEHTDTAGNVGVLGPGDVHWVTAGGGVLHSEMPAGDAEAHTVQVWINLPSHEKLRPPRHQVLRARGIPLVEDLGARVRVIAGPWNGAVGPAEGVLPVRFLEIAFEAGAEVGVPLPAGDAGFAYVLGGGVRASYSTLVAGDVAIVSNTAETTDELVLSASERAHVLVLVGPRLREPIVSHGPFVMGTQEQIAKCYDDLQRGTFAR